LEKQEQPTKEGGRSRSCKYAKTGAKKRKGVSLEREKGGRILRSKSPAVKIWNYVGRQAKRTPEANEVLLGSKIIKKSLPQEEGGKNQKKMSRDPGTELRKKWRMQNAVLKRRSGSPGRRIPSITKNRRVRRTLSIVGEKKVLVGDVKNRYCSALLTGEFVEIENGAS